ncbi:MAG: hypothetical protein QG574_4865 [Cyanobacteriota bacterium erpe_2018_sw_21hr_WHONDRS-SW48-000092_B_bin.40]|jgi:hypothetical protein|nr:hypothetical protein [Cyanobacteriota bacterium erpe_2018_sw_21hr_WHONDRS-SW48-000092_B_bin.40]
MNTQTVDLMSLYNDKTKEVVVPKGISASYDSSKGPCVLHGNLENHGTITITGPKKSSQVIIAAEIINDGAFDCQVESLSLCSSTVRNTGDIKAQNSLVFKSTAGKLSIDGSGSVTASQAITFSGSLGISVKNGTFESSSLLFEAENGTCFVQADGLEGAISVNAKSSRIGTKSAMLKDGKSSLLSGTHVYYSTSSLSLGNISHAGDAVVLLAGGDIAVGSITAGTLYVGAGVSFTIDGQYPDPTSDNDVDVPWSVSGPGYQPLVVSGAINVSGEATIKAWTVEATDVTVGGNLEVNTLNEYGEITLTGDLDVDGDASLLAYTINFEGEDFNVAGELVMGASASTGLYSYINLAGSLTASDNVSLNCQLTTFLGDDFTMDGTDKVLATSGHLRIEATDFINIKADVTSSEARNLLFYSDGDVATGSITVDNATGASAGAVAIKAHRTGGSTEFVIGGTDETNGVNGTITTDTVNGGATEVTSFSHGCVYITNGGDGGITVTSASNISVKGTSSKSGGITLNAEDGTIKLPAGTLSADGTGANAGSFIQLLAETIETVDGTIISASDTGASEKQKLLQIAANNITLTGTSGLEIKANGGGNSAYPTYLQIFPKGSVTIYDNDYAPSFLIWSYTESISYSGSAPVNFNGAGTAPLKISCNGSHSRTFISGYPLVFNTGETHIECKGDEDHELQIYRASASGGNGLQFNGGDVTIDASGLDDGDGGLLSIYMDPVYRSDTGRVVIKADGKDTGDGGHILLQPGTTDLVFGTADEQYSFSSKGGLTSGSGGKIEIQGYYSSIEVNGATDTTTVLDVSVPGTDGNGGEINIVAYGAAGLTFDASNPAYLKADGGSTSGDGGKIIIGTSNVPMTIGSGDGQVSLSAAALGDNGKGGTIDITSWSGISANSLDISVLATGTGDGGTIKLNAGYSTLSVSGPGLVADSGSTNGDGGLIDIQAGEIQIGILAFAALPSAHKLQANGSGTGKGGQINVLAQWGPLEIKNQLGYLRLEAKALHDGDGGLIKAVANSSTNSMTLDGASFDVSAGPTGNGIGGKIVGNAGANITIAGEFKAKGAGTGNGGIMEFEAGNDFNFDLATPASLNVDAGVTGGNGGSVKIKASGGLVIRSASKISANAVGGDGKGGSVYVDTPNNRAPLNGFAGTIIEAKGHGNGKGGNVTFTYCGMFQITDFIKVDSGSSAGVTVPCGVISLNGIFAGQWKTNNSVWPKTYWVATDGYEGSGSSGPSAYHKAHATMALHSNFNNIRATYASNNVELFLFKENTYFNGFYGSSEGELEGGLTFQWTSGGVSKIYCNPWQHGSRGTATPFTYDTDGVQEVAAHELGHAADIIFGLNSLNPLGNLAAAVTADFTTLNGVSGCAASAFSGVYSLHTSSNVCSGGVLTAPYSTYPSNKVIAQFLEEALFSPPSANQWTELGMQAFAFVATTGLTRTARPMADTIFANGAFANTRTWAANMLAGSNPG